MEGVAKESNITDHTGLIRLGGIAMLVGFTIHAVANWVLKVFPPENPSLAELQTYLLDEAGNWAIVHGIRYVAVVCIVLFAAGLFVRTCCIRSTASAGWGIVGLIDSEFGTMGRRAWALGLFFFAGCAILLSAEPFAEAEMLDVEPDEEREPLAARPVVVGPLRYRRIGIAAVMADFHDEVLGT